MGELSLENTHPFCLGNYTLGHNGTIVRYPRLLEPGMRRPEGNTDSEHLFNRLMHDFDPGAPVESLRETLRATVQCSPFSGLNVLFATGRSCSPTASACSSCTGSRDPASCWLRPSA